MTTTIFKVFFQIQHVDIAHGVTLGVLEHLMLKSSQGFVRGLFKVLEDT